MTGEYTQEDAVEYNKEIFDYPLYFVTGESVEEEGFVPAYYKVEGPNGPVSYMNPNSGPHHTTMHDLLMDAGLMDIPVEETPWDEEG